MSSSVPHLANASTLKSLTTILRKLNADVVILDPTYLAIGGGDIQSSNLFEMGAKYAAVAKACLDAGCTPVLLHHTRMHMKVGKALELDDLAFVGIQEFARQWILLNRRVAFRNDGFHELVMTVGGSAGHCGQYDVAISEGKLRKDFTGRFWKVSVKEATPAAAGPPAAAKEGKGKKRHSDEELKAIILNALDKLCGDKRPAGFTAVRTCTGLNGSTFKGLVEVLVAENKLVLAEGSRGKTLCRSNTPAELPSPSGQ